MALNKQSVPINFAKGLDLKTDPFQIAIGKFLALENTQFNKTGLLEKRNGYGKLTTLPDLTSTFVTTFNGNLTAVGTYLQAYSASGMSWINKGALKPAKIDTLPLIRSNTNQAQADSVVASNGLVCTVFTDNVPSGGVAVANYKYAIANSVTGQNIVAPTVIPVTSGAVTGAPRVFLLGNYFVIVFTNLITATYHLQYVAISTTNPTSVTTNADLSAQYTPSARLAFDGYVINSKLFLAWNGSDGGGAIRMTYLNAALTQANTVTFATRVATIMSVTADASTSYVYASFYNSGTSTGYTLAVDTNLNTILAPTQTITTGTILNISTAAQAGTCTVFYEVSTAYAYGTTPQTNIVKSRTITSAGTLGTAATVARSVGLASKAFIIESVIYFLAAYSSTNQPTYFLMDSSGNIIAKLAYSNGGGYLATGTPNITVTDNVVQIPYLIKDLVQSLNKGTALASDIPTAQVYTQTGINLVSFTIGTSNVSAAEIGNNLHLSGGITWAYDGYVPVEQGFHLWPDYVETSTATGAGGLTAQDYYYVATYEWSDNQGNIFRSAPSIPVKQTTTTGSSTNTINVPTLRLTYKSANPVKIVVYRWSTAQQTYYQITSISVPTLNSLTADSVAITDTSADSAIIGNNILYTAGGVVENIGLPAVDDLALFKSRLFFIHSENKNLLGYTKQVIEGTPVEASDLFSIYVAPTTGAQGSTGPMKCLAALDDKLIIFKKNAISYQTGTGPDNTGANNDFSEPTFITSTVGCDNKQSIVFMPNGLMFQSDKGIWLLGRDLNTSFIGEPVQELTDAGTVQSAVNVPGTNQVRFTLDTGITLMYDYLFNEWSTFVNVPAISSTLYEDLHTFVNDLGEVYQETIGAYLDGSSPVLMSFTTGWLNMAGLQGFERAYYFYLLGTYITPHKLRLQIAYDYDPAIQQMSTIIPDNYNPPYGGEALWGSGGVWGGNATVEQWKIHLARQKCQSFRITLDEIYDPSYSVAAGAGCTLSGINLIAGSKSNRPMLKAARAVG